MRLRIFVLALVAALAVASTALAATNKLKGKVKGDANSKVTLKATVKKKDGVRRPTRLRALKLTKVNYKCEDGTTGEKTANLGAMGVGLVGFPKPFPYFTIDKTVKGVRYSGSGKLNRKGTKINGRVNLFFVDKRPQPDGSTTEQDCGSELKFSAKRK